MKLSVMVLFIAQVSASAFPQTQVPQNWIPDAIYSLAENASSHSEFSLDRSMLVMASKQDQDDDSVRRVIAGINGISVHRFRFQGAGMYDSHILNTLRQQYHTAGWQHVSSAHDKYGYPSGTDLWLRLDHNVIRNIAVLFAGENQVNFISVSGSISPIDLLHLSGHFGIPKVEGGVVVPSPEAAPLPPPDPQQ